MLITVLRSRIFALLTHAVLWVLLVMTLAQWDDDPPRWGAAAASGANLKIPVPIAPITNLVAAMRAAGTITETNANPFFTRHFIPPVVPPPPPPTTRQAPVTYHGYFRAADGPIRAFLSVDGQAVTGPVGALAAKTWRIAEITPTAVVLTNATAVSNRIRFNETVPVQVPAGG